MAKFKSSLKRELRLHEIQAPVIVIIDANGIQMGLPGFRKRLGASWEEIARKLRVPDTAPAYLDGKPIEFLKYLEFKWRRRNARALDKGAGLDR